MPHYGKQQCSKRGDWLLKEPWWNPDAFFCVQGVFQAPGGFGKKNASAPAGPSNPIGVEQYPAMFFVRKDLYYELHDRGVLPKGVSAEQDPDVLLNNLRHTNPHRMEHGVSTIAVTKTGAGGGDGAGGGGQGDGSNEDDYGKKLTHHYHTEKLLPPGATILEVHARPLGDFRVIMVCLKIALAGSTPWWVNLSFVRFLSPL